MYVSKNKQLLIFQYQFGVLDLERCFLISSVICMGKITLCDRQYVARKLQIEWLRYILCFRDIYIGSQLQDFYTIYILTICIIHCCIHITFYATTHHLSTRRLLHIFYATETCPQQDNCKIFTWDIQEVNQKASTFNNTYPHSGWINCHLVFCGKRYRTCVCGVSARTNSVPRDSATQQTIFSQSALQLCIVFVNYSVVFNMLCNIRQSMHNIVLYTPDIKP